MKLPACQLISCPSAGLWGIDRCQYLFKVLALLQQREVGIDRQVEQPEGILEEAVEGSTILGDSARRTPRGNGAGPGMAFQRASVW
jgi:hypothetical protein